MKIIANGHERPVESGWTVSDFIESMGFEPKYVVVELNGEALARERFAAAELAEGDRIEVVRAVAGGSEAKPDD